MNRRELIRLRRRLQRTRPFEDTFRYRVDDVVIVSYPRSGSTWLRFIIAHLINEMMPDGPQEVDFWRVQRIVPAISQEALEKAGADYEALPSPRIMRSHSMHMSKFPKVIYLLRDGRDVMISYYYYYKKRNNYKGSLYDFMCSDCRPMVWGKHVDSCVYQNPSLSNVCVVRYEDLLRNPVHEVENLLYFAGTQFPTEQICKAIEESTFDKMRLIEEIKGLGYSNEGNLSIRNIRMGKSGQWRSDFGDKEKAIFKSRYGNALIRAGYEKSFNW